MAEVIGSPRFEELVRQDEYVLRLCHFVVEHRLRTGNATEAEEIAERALAISRTLRPAGVAESPLVAESRYALARALAPRAANDPTVARLAAELLREAARSNRRYLDEDFPRDKLFKAAREPIAAFLRESEPSIR